MSLRYSCIRMIALILLVCGSVSCNNDKGFLSSPEGTTWIMVKDGAADMRQGNTTKGYTFYSSGMGFPIIYNFQNHKEQPSDAMCNGCKVDKIRDVFFEWKIEEGQLFLPTDTFLIEHLAMDSLTIKKIHSGSADTVSRVYTRLL